MQRGAFIALDGLDGSGKATQTRLLAARFAGEGVACERMDFPRYDSNCFGALIGECLAGQHGDFANLDPKIASTLYACDRRESAPAITAILARGAHVIADRFTSANQIHQGGKIADETARIAFIEWLDRMEHEVVGVPRPDAVIYLRVPPEITLELLAKKRSEKNQSLGGVAQDQVESDRAYVTNSYACAQWLASTQKHWHTIDCAQNGTMRSPEEIHEEMYRLVATLVPSAASGATIPAYRP